MLLKRCLMTIECQTCFTYQPAWSWKKEQKRMYVMIIHDHIIYFWRKPCIILLSTYIPRGYSINIITYQISPYSYTLKLSSSGTVTVEASSIPSPATSLLSMLNVTKLRKYLKTIYPYQEILNQLRLQLIQIRAKTKPMQMWCY